MGHRIGATALLGAGLLGGCSVSVADVDTSESALLAKSQLTWARHLGTTAVDRVFDVATRDGTVYAVGQTFGSLTTTPNPGGSDAFLRRYDANGTIVWTRQFEDGDFEAAYAIAVDASGVYVAGEHDDSFVTSAFVRKYDHDGNLVWATTFREGTTVANGLAVDATGLYIVGRVAGAFEGHENAGGDDVFIRKLERATGAQIWVRQFGTGSDDNAARVFVDGSGVYIAGATAGAFPGHPNAVGVDPFVAKLDLNGTTGLWLRQFGSDDVDYVTGLSGDGAGVYVATLRESSPVTGEVRRFDANGNTLWSRTQAASFDLGPKALAADATGVYVAGNVGGSLPGYTIAGSSDAYVRRYDKRGKETWTVQLGSGGVDETAAIVATPSGIIIGGSSDGAWSGATNAGETDGFVVKFTVSTGPSRSR